MADPEFLGLSGAIEGLRADLQEAWELGKDARVRFRASEVTVTLQAVARKEGSAEAKVRWWVIEGGGGLKTSREATQTVVLKLTPLLLDDKGEETGPLTVGADQRSRGG